MIAHLYFLVWLVRPPARLPANLLSSGGGGEKEG